MDLCLSGNIHVCCGVDMMSGLSQWRGGEGIGDESLSTSCVSICCELMYLCPACCLCSFAWKWWSLESDGGSAIIALLTKEKRINSRLQRIKKIPAQWAGEWTPCLFFSKTGVLKITFSSGWRSEVNWFHAKKQIFFGEIWVFVSVHTESQAANLKLHTNSHTVHIYHSRVSLTWSDLHIFLGA